MSNVTAITTIMAAYKNVTAPVKRPRQTQVPTWVLREAVAARSPPKKRKRKAGGAASSGASRNEAQALFDSASGKGQGGKARRSGGGGSSSRTRERDYGALVGWGERACNSNVDGGVEEREHAASSSTSEHADAEAIVGDSECRCVTGFPDETKNKDGRGLIFWGPTD